MEPRRKSAGILRCGEFTLANKLVVDRLSAGYGAVSVLRDVSLEVREGELVALLGTNGNGKSTLLNAILGLVRPTAGSVRLEWDGEVVELAGRPAEQIVELGIALVPEGRRLFPHLTVEENLVLGGSGRRARGRLRGNLEFAFSTFPMLQERRHQRAGTMSGGQQQLLAIARALMTMPRIVLIDEPSVGLAPVAVDHVLSTIKMLQAERNLTVLMAEQSVVQAIAIAGRSYLLTHGRVAREVDREHAAASTEEIRSALLGGVG
jgi:branched-chain amino acid transport system ATP-binding protein